MSEALAESVFGRRPMPVLVYEVACESVRELVARRWPTLVPRFTEYRAPGAHGPLLVLFSLHHLGELERDSYPKAVPFGTLRVEYERWRSFDQQATADLIREIGALLDDIRPLIEF